MKSAIATKVMCFLWALLSVLWPAGQILGQSNDCTLQCPAATTLFVDDLCEFRLDSAATASFTPAVSDDCAVDISFAPLLRNTAGDTLYNPGFAPLPSLQGLSLSLGQSTLSWYVRDSVGIRDSCQLLLTVRDTTPPRLNCPLRVQLTPPANSGCSYPVAGTEINPLSWTDNCPVAGISFAPLLRNMAGDTLYNPGFAATPSLQGLLLNRGQSILNWVVRDAAGNSSSCEMSVEVRAAYEGQLQPWIDGQPVDRDTTCQQNEYRLSYQPANLAIVSRRWSRNGSLLSSDGSFLLESPAAAGTYRYELLITDNAGCTYPLDYNVLVHPLPMPAIEGQSLLCAGSRVQLQAEDSYVAYQWTIDGAPAGNEALYISEPVGVPGSFRYRLTVTDSIGCTGTDSLTVQLISNPQPMIEGVFSICANQQELVFVAEGGIPAGSGRSFTWQIPGDWATVLYRRSDSLAIRVVNPLPAGPHRLLVREELVSSQLSCAGSDTLSLAVIGGQTAPDVSAIGYLPAGNVLVCADAGYCYQWGFTDRQTGNESLLAGENYQTYVAQSNWNPAGRQYWVDTWAAADPCGTPPACRTRSYYDRELPTAAAEVAGEVPPSVHIFPNPNKGSFLLSVAQWPHRQATLLIVDAAGRRHWQSSVQVADYPAWEWQLTGAANQLPPGLYWLCLVHENAVLAAATFVVQQ